MINHIFWWAPWPEFDDTSFLKLRLQPNPVSKNANLHTYDFETKGILRDYTKVNIPAAKKKVGVNRADMNSDTKTDNSEWEKNKKPISVDNKIKGMLREIAEEKAKDPKNNNLGWSINHWGMQKRKC